MFDSSEGLPLKLNNVKARIESFSIEEGLGEKTAEIRRQMSSQKIEQLECATNERKVIK